MKYYLIGTYPPPLGGVSVYIYRYKKMLGKMEFSPESIDYGKMSRKDILLWLLNILFNKRTAVYNLNSLNLVTMLALIMRPFGKKIILTMHSGHSLNHISLLKKNIFIWFLSIVDELVLVGENIKENFIENGYPLPENITIKNSFLPPPFEEEEQILKTYSAKVIEFLNSHKPVIIANASKITFHNNEDLYGLDMCVELTAKLKPLYPEIGFLFALAVDSNERNYLEDIKGHIKRLGISTNFLIMTGNKEIWPLFKKTDLMIRPTNTDSFGISIAESIYMGCPAIASDVCVRPEGTILFRNRSIDDLFDKSKEVLSKCNK